jgi:hypothetical protein
MLLYVIHMIILKRETQFTGISVSPVAAIHTIIGYLQCAKQISY